MEDRGLQFSIGAFTEPNASRAGRRSPAGPSAGPGRRVADSGTEWRLQRPTRLVLHRPMRRADAGRHGVVWSPLDSNDPGGWVAAHASRPLILATANRKPVQGACIISSQLMRGVQDGHSSPSPTPNEGCGGQPSNAIRNKPLYLSNPPPLLNKYTHTHS